VQKIIPFPEDPHFSNHDIPERENDLPQRDTDLIQNIGIHVDYLDDLANGKPFGANIIDMKKWRSKK
jgi:hypothetical protein